MFLTLAAAALLHTPPVLPPPKASSPAPASLVDTLTDAPMEIRDYCEAAQQEQRRRRSESIAVADQLERDLKLRRSGRIVPDPSQPAVRYVADAKPPHYEFATRDDKAEAIRACRAAEDAARADARYFSRDDIFVQPVIDDFRLGAMGRIRIDDHHRYLALQVVDDSDVLVQCQYRREGLIYKGGDRNVLSSYGPDLTWQDGGTIWVEGVDTSGMRDGAAIDLSGAAFLIDRSRTYDAAGGGTNTVLNVRRLELEKWLPHDLIEARGEPRH